jgi:hypothetical protein
MWEGRELLGTIFVRWRRKPRIFPCIICFFFFLLFHFVVVVYLFVIVVCAELFSCGGPGFIS